MSGMAGLKRRMCDIWLKALNLLSNVSFGLRASALRAQGQSPSEACARTLNGVAFPYGAIHRTGVSRNARLLFAAGRTAADCTRAVAYGHAGAGRTRRGLGRRGMGDGYGAC